MDPSQALADAATVALPVLVVLLLLLLFLLIPLVNRYRKVRRHLLHDAYPVRLARELVRLRQQGKKKGGGGGGGGGSLLGQPLDHAEDDGDEAEEEAAGAKPIYLDWNATSQVYPEVALAMLPYLYSRCGNPGSAHAYARAPRAAVARARAALAELVGAEDPAEIVFASCGTEAINWALRAGVQAGWARCKARHPGVLLEGTHRPHVVTTAIEHPAVLALLRRMEAERAIDLDVVGVSEEGLVRPDDVAVLLRPATALVAVMHANNEVGSLQPIPEIAAHCRRHGAPLLFVDAAQSAGKVPVTVGEGGALAGADMVSIVGHKFGAPKGVAALYIRQGLERELEPLLVGGGQERGLRSGTESVLLIAGLGEAAAIARREQPALQAHMEACTALLRERLVAELGEDGLRFNGPRDPAQRLPNTTSVSFRHLQGPRLVAALADAVALSAGSACHAHAHGPGQGLLRASAVLEAMRVPLEYGLGTLRVSCGRHTSLAEVREAAALIARAVKAERAGALVGEGGGDEEQEEEEEEVTETP